MQLSATTVLAVLAAVSFVCGALLSVIISLMIGSAKMRRKAREEQMRQGVMDGLSRSCDGIEATIAAVDTNSMNAGWLRSEVLKRIGALERRLGQYADTLDTYYIAYINLRLQSYRQLIAKLDGLVADITKYGGVAPSPVQAEPAAAEPAEEPAAEAAPVPPPVAMPQEMEPEAPAAAPVAEAAPAPEPVAPDVNVGATMAFDVLGMQGQDAGGEQPVLFGGAIAEPPAQPEAPAQPVTPAAEAPVAPGLTDEDMMYGQTMQFSMTDIEAARRRETAEPAAPPEPMTAEPAMPFAEQPAPEPEAPPALSPAVSGDMGETIVFAVDDTMAPAVEPPPAPAMEMPAAQPAPQTPPTPPRPQAAETTEEKSGGQAGMITGNDLMEQMDAFFNFNQ